MNDSQEPASRDEELESIVLGCLESGDFDSALDAACRRDPDHSEKLRHIAEELRRFGILETSPGESSIPERIGRFRLVERIGAGGMGMVFRAIEDDLDREVAIKIVRPEHLLFEGGRLRFAREVEAVARLQHPGIVPIYAAGNENGVPYFTMELVDGKTLEEILGHLSGREPATLTGADLCSDAEHREPTGSGHESRETRIFEKSHVDACLDIVTQIAEALRHAHECGVFHRDVKPSNIILTAQGDARLLDFGLAFTADSQRLTRTSSQIGSLPYLPPEQILDPTLQPGARQDVYALGVTMYELLTLKCPFLGARADETRQRILDANPLRPSQLNRKIPWDLETVCLTAMDKQLSRRYATLTDLLRDLGHLRARRTIEARRPGPLLRLRRWEQRHPAVALAGIVALLTITIASVVFAVTREGLLRREKNAKETALEKTYASKTLSASLALTLGQVRRAKRILAECDPVLRGLEWRLLHKTSDTSRLVIYNGGGASQHLSFCPDNPWLAVSSGGGKWAKVWNTETGALVNRLDHETTLRRPSWRGDRLLIGAEGALLEWDVENGEVVRRYELPDDARGRLVGASVASRLGSYAGTDSGRIHFWRSGDRLPSITLDGHRGAVFQLSLHETEPRMLSAAMDSSVRLWDTETGTCITTTSTRPDWYSSAHFVDADTFTVGGGGRTLRAFRSRTGEPWPKDDAPFLPQHSRPETIHYAFRRGGKEFVALASFLRRLGVWSVASGTRMHELVGHEVTMSDLAYSPDGEHVAAAADDGSVRIWNRRAGKRHPFLRAHPSAIYAIAASHDGRIVYSGDSRGSVRALDAHRNEILWTNGDHTKKVTSLALHEPAGILVSASLDHSIRIWDPNTGGVRIVSGTRPVQSISIAPDATNLLAGFGDGSAAVIAIDSGEILHRFETAAPVTAVEWSGDGERFAIGNRRGDLQVFDARTWRSVYRIGTRAAITCLDSAPDGSTLAVGLADTVVLVCDAATGATKHALRGHARSITAVRYTPDGERLITTGGFDTHIGIWDPRTGQHFVDFREPLGVFALDVIGDGRGFVSGGMAKRPVVWEDRLPFKQRSVGQPPEDPYAGRVMPDGDHGK